METFTELEKMIDRKQTIAKMKKEMVQLYYFTGRKVSLMEFSIQEPEAVYDVGEKKARKDLLQRSSVFASQITKEMKKLPEKERMVLEALYVSHLDRKTACKKLHITDSTLRRRNQDGLYHLAILMHQVVMKDI